MPACMAWSYSFEIGMGRIPVHDCVLYGRGLSRFMSPTCGSFFFTFAAGTGSNTITETVAPSSGPSHTCYRKVVPHTYALKPATEKCTLPGESAVLDVKECRLAAEMLDMDPNKPLRQVGDFTSGTPKGCHLSQRTVDSGGVNNFNTGAESYNGPAQASYPRHERYCKSECGGNGAAVTTKTHSALCEITTTTTTNATTASTTPPAGRWREQQARPWPCPVAWPLHRAHSAPSIRGRVGHATAICSPRLRPWSHDPPPTHAPTCAPVRGTTPRQRPACTSCLNGVACGVRPSMRGTPAGLTLSAPLLQRDWHLAPPEAHVRHRRDRERAVNDADSFALSLLVLPCVLQPPTQRQRRRPRQRPPPTCRRPRQQPLGRHRRPRQRPPGTRRRRRRVVRLPPHQPPPPPGSPTSRVAKRGHPRLAVATAMTTTLTTATTAAVRGS